MLSTQQGIREEVARERTPGSSWWTGTLPKALEGWAVSYLPLWRNAGRMPDGNMHDCTPRQTDPSAEDFKEFYPRKRRLFQREVAKEKIYGVR